MRPASFWFNPADGTLHVREPYGPTGASYDINDGGELVISSEVGEYSSQNGYIHLSIEEEDAFALNVKLSSRTLTCKGSLLSPGGVTTQLTAEDIVGFQVDESCTDSGLPLGAARASKLTLRLNNSQKQWLGVNLDGYKLTLELGVLFDTTYVYTPVGEYIIEAGKAQEQDTISTYSGSDRMAGTMLRAFTDSTEYYPCTVQQLLQRVASQAQITLSSTVFPNASTVIPSMPAWPGDTTLREVAGYVACVACGFARIGRTGELEIVPLSNSKHASIGPDRYKTLDKPGNMFGPLNAIYVSPYGAPEGATASRYPVDADVIDNAANSVQISSNPLLAYGSPSLAALTENMLSAIGGLTVQAATLSWPGDPTWECGDRISVTDLQDNVIETIITRQKLTFGTGFSSVSSCVIDGVTKTDSRNRSTKIFTPDGNVNAAKVVGSMDLMRIWMRASDSFVDAEIINGKGTLRENTNPESPYYGATYEGPGFTAFANEKNENGEWIWRIGITPRGIVGDQVYIETEDGVFLSAKKALEDTNAEMAASLSVTSEAINASATRITTIESALPGMATKTEVNAKYASAKLDADGLSVRVGNAEGILSELESDATGLKNFKTVQETVFRVTTEGAVVGQTGVPTSVLVAANRVAIRDQYNNEVTRITDNNMDIENASIRKQLSVGYVARVKLSDGSCGDKWIG